MKYLTKLSVLLIAALVVTLCLFASPTKASAATEGYYTYEESNGEATITDCDISISGNITIPSTLGGYPVTSIGDYAFYRCYSLTSVTIGDSVTSIGEHAFSSCTNLTSVTIPDSVTSIGSSAFCWCTSLTSVTIGDSVTSIGSSVFCWCTSLTSVTIPDSVTSIGSSAFRNCSSLTSVTIGDSVTSIGDEAFYECESLTSVTIGNSVTSIGSGAFYNCDRLTSVTIPDSVTSIDSYAFLYCKSLTGIHVDANNPNYSSDAYGVLFSKDKTQLIQAPGGLLGSYSIPDSVTSIGNYSFEDCAGLTSVTIPDSVTRIGNYSFEDCIGLTSVTIPDSVTSIGSSAFYGCTSLTSVTIPDSVTSIGSSAFRECTSLTSVTIPDSVTAIPDYAFFYCISLTSVTIPDSVISIGDNAFWWCSSLTSVTIPNSVTSIGDSAFSHCDSLTSVTIPDSVASIGDYAFEYCTSLTSVTYCGTEERWNQIVIGDCNSPLISATRYYHKWSTPACATEKVCIICGENDGQWPHSYVDGSCSYCGINEPCGENLTWTLDDDGTLTISGTGAMVDYKWGETTLWYTNRNSIIRIVIEDNVTSIGDWVFSYLTNLTSISIPDSVTSIGNNAFDSCKSLTSVTIPDSVISIGYDAFYSCTSLTMVVISNGVTVIDNATFNGCTSLTSVTIGNAVTSIGDWAFSGCDRLTSVNIPNSVLNIGERAFESCDMLNEVTYCGTEEDWNRIEFGTHNSSLLNAPRTYHSWVAATCDTAKHCTLCGLTEGTAGHSGNYWFIVLAPTCTMDGIRARICDVCKETEVEAVSHSHNYEIIVTKPTCTEGGYTTQTCLRCGETTVYDYVPATGHFWSAWIPVFEASCTMEGYQLRFCNCGLSEKEYFAQLPHNYVDGICTDCNQSEKLGDKLQNHVQLFDLSLTEDLYIDLNGYSLSGTIITNGFKVYGMDSTTNSYTCDQIGYFSCVDENGNAIIPESFYTTEDMMRYMTIETENGYTFHRFYPGITNISLAPSVTGFGYKAEFYGDEMVQAEIASIGYNLWLTEDVVISRTSAFKNTLILRLKNFDVVNYGETPVNACVTITLTDGTVIESATASYSMRQVVEQLNESATDLDEAKLSAVASMIANNPTMQSWKVEKIYKKP